MNRPIFNEAITQAINNDDAQELMRILNNDHSFFAQGHFEQEYRFECFDRCVKDERNACLNVLIERCNDQELNNKALVHAAKTGKRTQLEMLIPFSDPLYDDSRAIIAAVQNAHKDCVELLIPHSDLTAEYSFVLECAIFYEWEDIVELVYPLSDVKKLLKHLQTDIAPEIISNAEYERLFNTLKERLAYDERALIEQQITTTHSSKINKKI